MRLACVKSCGIACTRRRACAARCGAPWPRVTGLSSSSAAQLRRPGYCSSGRSKQQLGPLPRAAAGCRARTYRRARCSVIIVSRSLAMIDFLDFGRALVDAQRAHLAVELLDRMAAHHAEPAADLHRVVDHRAAPPRWRTSSPSPPRGSRARRRVTSAPRRAIGEQRRGVDRRSPCRRACAWVIWKSARVWPNILRAARLRERLVQRAAREPERGGGDRGAEDVQLAHRQLEALARLAEQLGAGLPEAYASPWGAAPRSSMRSRRVDLARPRR